LATSVPAIPIEKTDVGCLKRRTIIRSITSDTNYLANHLESFDKNFLVFWRGTSKDLESRNDGNHLRLGELAEVGTFHNNTTRSEDTTLRGDGASRKDVIASAHLDSNTGTMAFDNSLAHTIAEGVFNTGDANEGQIL
jgi:hypothetical protein